MKENVRFGAAKSLKMVRNKHMHEEACEMKLHNENLIRDTIKCVGVLPRLATSDGSCVPVQTR